MGAEADEEDRREACETGTRTDGKKETETL